jgi:hypothetical protein
MINNKENPSMAKRLVSMMILVSSIGILAGCDNSAENSAKSTDKRAEITAPTEQSQSADSTNTSPTNDIDWSAIASDETPADLAGYEYPFAFDSQNVRDYADYFDVDNAIAQHNLTIGMASNEALSKVLDQLSTNYVSHELTDSDNIELIVHTTPNISASSHDYVFSDDFAKGLVLPIVIKPDGIKTDVDPHAGS